MIPKLSARLEQAILTAIEARTRPAILVVGHDLSELSAAEAELAGLDHRVLMTVSCASAIRRLHDDSLIDSLLILSSVPPHEASELVLFSSSEFPTHRRLISARGATQNFVKRLVSIGCVDALVEAPLHIEEIATLLSDERHGAERSGTYLRGRME